MYKYLAFILFPIGIFVTISEILHAKDADGNYRKVKEREIPEYMFELYEKYKNDPNGFFSSKETARCILPNKGKINEQEMLTYNLTTLPTSEVIYKAELHVNILSKQLEDRSYFLNLWDTGLMTPLEEYKIYGEVGWTTYDVTQIVLKCITEKGEGQIFLGLSVHGSGNQRKPYFMSVSEIIDLQKQPFLMLFSEDVTANPKKNGAYHSIPDDAIRKSLKSRKKRFVDDIQGDDDASNNVDDFETPSPIPSPGSCGDNANTKQRGKKNKGKGRQQRKQQFQYKQDSQDGNDTVVIDDDQEESICVCQKRDLTVDFEKIGWYDWAIHPRYLMINYCSGHCNYPLSENMSPSGHAVVQSLVHTFNPDRNIPAPCCVPRDMSPALMLYFDENSKVVLRRFPDMIAESCGCQ